jgi:hypothetical protein
MALVGHISGSAQSQSVIGVTGSVVFANQPAVSFPSITSVGSDVVFFVSGAVGGKNVANQKTVAVFGGDAVVSGSLSVGSGSLKITSNDIQFSSVLCFLTGVVCTAPLSNHPGFDETCWPGK